MEADPFSLKERSLGAICYSLLKAVDPSPDGGPPHSGGDFQSGAWAERVSDAKVSVQGCLLDSCQSGFDCEMVRGDPSLTEA